MIGRAAFTVENDEPHPFFVRRALIDRHTVKMK